MCPAAVLRRRIDASATRFTVSPYTYPLDETTAPYRDKVTVNVDKLREQDGRIGGPADLIPIFASTTGPRDAFADVDAAVDVERATEDDEGEDALRASASYRVELDRRYIDPETCDYLEGAITMPAATGKILLINSSLDR